MYHYEKYQIMTQYTKSMALSRQQFSIANTEMEILF